MDVSGSSKEKELEDCRQEAVIAIPVRGVRVEREKLFKRTSF